MSTCATCGSHLRSVDGVCPTCMAKSITSFLKKSNTSDDAIDVPGYTLHEIIGRGGMGIVFRATRDEDSTVVAVKLLPAHLADDDEIADRFAREAQALAAFDHPHVLRVLDSGITLEGRLFIVTEFAAGGDLAQRLQGGQLPVDEALRTYREVLRAIDEAHRQGIVHRDIKPANILLDEHGSVRVADFSLAKLLRDNAGPQLTLTQSADVFGTPYYIAPEVRRGAGSVDERADIFSLGVLLHEMLTGRVPIGHYEPASRVAKVPTRVDAFIARCLSEAPEKRVQSLAELRAALEICFAPRKTVMWIALGVLAAVLLVAWFDHQAKQSAASPQEATSTRPWSNSLGMKFVPVPGTKTLFSTWETRRRDFAAFANKNPGNDIERAWEKPEGNVTSDHPVCLVNWLRAEQFCAWLTKTEHERGTLPQAMRYRLPTDVEWSTAAGLPAESGATPEARNRGLGPIEHAPYSWGRSWPPPSEGIKANFAGQEAETVVPPFAKPVLRTRDAWPWSAPVGSFKPNALGLYDLSGNVSEWCLDAWNDLLPDKTVRGGAHNQSAAMVLRLDGREHLSPTRQLIGVGFRVVIDVGS
ncbi:MAG: protein kinase [Verrucomicrobiaceae bacterium]|nr:protein kinase [Verrucomicrobiaceae bacterium]